MLAAQNALALELLKQRRFDGRAQRAVADVDVGIGGEGAGLSPAVGIDVEKFASCRHAAAHGQLVAGEGEQNGLLVAAAKRFHGLGHVGPLRLTGSQMPGFLCDRHKLHIDDQPAAAAHQIIQEGPGGDFPHVFGGDRDRRTEDQAVFLEFLHVCHQALVDAGAPAGVGDLAPALDAQNRDEVAARIEQAEITLVHKGAVGEDGEEDAAHFSRCLHDVAADHRFAAGQEDEADAQLLRLAEDPQPFLARELIHGGRVIRRPAAAGIAARAVEVAAAGDAGDQKARNVQALLFQLQPPL